MTQGHSRRTGPAGDQPDPKATSAGGNSPRASLKFLPQELLPDYLLPGSAIPRDLLPIDPLPGGPLTSKAVPDEALPDETPTDETPADEAPADEMFADETPAGETPADETPADETPADEMFADEAPAGGADLVETISYETETNGASQDADADHARRAALREALGRAAAPDAAEAGAEESAAGLSDILRTPGTGDAPGAGYAGGSIGTPPLASGSGVADSALALDSVALDPSALVQVHPDMPKVDPNLVFGATMALWQPPRFTPQELLDTINEILEGTGAVAQFDPKMGETTAQPKFSLLKRRLKGPPSAMLRVNGLSTMVGGSDKPAFTGKAAEQRVNPALWAEGVQRLSRSRGHVMVADAHPNDPNDPDLNYDRAVAVTVTAAAVSLLTDAAGIVWHPAGNATPPDVIPDFVQSLADGLAPLPLWLRWLLVPSTSHNTNPGAATRGLEALLGMEMEIVPNKKSLEQTVGHLFQLAAIHVRLGKAPPDGSQVGTKDKTWYHVEYVRHGAVTRTPIYRLTPVSAYTGG